MSEAIVEGFGNKLADIPWDSPDYQMLAELQNNAWQFSAAKSASQIRDMNAALIGPDGKLRSYNDFKIAAQQITNEQLRWLRTEYDSAIAGAQMAAKWKNIVAKNDKFPLLQFDAVIDERTSAICRPLDKVTLPVDDPFWRVYYPPNHFNCRSTVRQLRTGEVTDKADIKYPENVPDNFKFNVGIEGRAFPTDGDYYDDLPAHLVNNATLYMPEDEQYIIKYQAEDGTQLRANRKTDIEKGTDYEDLLKVGKILADEGITVDLLPIVHANETDLRDELLHGVAENKNPDMLVNGEYAELKTASDPNYAQLQKLVANAAKQANRVIVLLDKEYAEKDMKAVAENRFKVFPDLEEIGFVTADGEYIEFKNHKGQH
ncbi:MAG: minor capsid protein [Mucilaginibacter sp.]